MSTQKVILFVVAMTVVVALLLAGSAVGLAPIAEKNADIFNKRQLLLAIANPLEAAGQPAAALTDEEVLAFFDENVEQSVVNSQGELVNQEGLLAVNVDLAKERKKPEAERNYPVYKANVDNSNYYIFSVRGNGLWDAIWGNVALEQDLNTIAGVSFDHAGETPGLGAEIKDNATWRAQFVGKKIYEGEKYVSVYVRKGGALQSRAEHEVDGLSGATITADGVTKMMYEGLQAYEPFMEESATTSTSMNFK
ncbi:NADH:ubiquinone reductase (Na(+)-transporting) subunit C [Neolewinella antarctica]|uniref:Na(+)-translocating NADH-quinone reductase subunit C n=1 Tax=Neolewinella antarctica TaxID=442734 RepID=A0ABX0XED8_9BACT|nr:NADH:ubiquinone reductase (Na(+)-transporting) subunit C [Neolewinella antarctica]NJC27274.1 Na+-transporting NADH:ubiquinone oxidoreductase subunit C [Neolewinella antarctica]